MFQLKQVPGKMSSEKPLLYHVKGLRKAFVFLHLQKTSLLCCTCVSRSEDKMFLAS